MRDENKKRTSIFLPQIGYQVYSKNRVGIEPIASKDQAIELLHASLKAPSCLSDAFTSFAKASRIVTRIFRLNRSQN
jgi:hypothetical protein